MPIFKVTGFRRPPAAQTVQVRRSAQFPARIMPAGTRKSAVVSGRPMTTSQHFNTSMASQASRVPRLANLTAASLAIRTGGRARKG